MKKLLAMLLALVMMLGCVAFGEVIDYTGTWVLTGAESAGTQLNTDVLALLGLDMTMTLNADGTMTISMMGMEESGTWVVTENGVAITDDEETLEVAYQNEILLLNQDGEILMLTREGAAPAIGADAASFNYVGAWVLSGVEMFGIKMDPAAVGVSGDVILYEDGTCTLILLDESQDGTWAVTETGITTTDAEGVVDTYTLVNGELVVEQDGMKLIFVQYAPLSGLTVADFNGTWSLSYIEIYDYSTMTQDFCEAEEIGVSMVITLADGKGHVEMSDSGVTEAYEADCIVDSLEDGSSVMYFLMLDENGVQDGSGLMLMMYPGNELTWYEYDSVEDVEYYYNFVLVTE